jgi:hypothetical protein
LLSLFIASPLILSLSKNAHAQIPVIRNVTGPKRVLWIVANYTDRTNALNESQARALMAEIDKNTRESSYGGMWLVGVRNPNQPGGDVIVVNTTLTSQTCQPATVHAQGRATAEAQGCPLTQYDAFMSLMPQSQCHLAEALHRWALTLRKARRSPAITVGVSSATNLSVTVLFGLIIRVARRASAVALSIATPMK